MGTRWFSRRALALHATVIVVVPVFFALCDWQVHRALSGNGLSWAYAFEWPFFACYAVFMWWRLLHEQDVPLHFNPKRTNLDPRNPDPRNMETIAADRHEEPSDLLPARSEIEPDPVDEELVAYNRYLAALSESGRHKRW